MNWIKPFKGCAVIALLVIGVGACKSALLGENAFVVPETAEIRSSINKTSRSVGTLKRGDQVTIIERTDEGTESYARVKVADGSEGWLVARNLVTQKNIDLAKEFSNSVSSLPIQAECKNRSSVKLRLTPDKSSDENVIVQLPAGVTFEVVDRETRPKADNAKSTERTVESEDKTANYEVWYKVRVKDNEIVPAGYVYAGSVEMDVPSAIAYFAPAGKRIVGWQKLGSIKDERGEDNFHYVIFAKTLSVPDEKSAFDFMNIVGFDPRNKSVSYYNVLRETVRGLYPATVKLDGRRATIQFNALDTANTERSVQYTVEPNDRGHLRVISTPTGAGVKK